MSVKEQMSEVLNLPKDLTLGAVILTITGKHEAYVENYMSLIEYTENQIRIQTRKMCIRDRDPPYSANRPAGSPASRLPQWRDGSG